MVSEDRDAKRWWGRAISIAALVLAGTSVVQVFSGGPLALATGAGGLAAAGAAGAVDPESESAPGAFLVCVALVLVALVSAWIRR